MSLRKTLSYLLVVLGDSGWRCRFAELNQGSQDGEEEEELGLKRLWSTHGRA